MLSPFLLFHRASIPCIVLTEREIKTLEAPLGKITIKQTKTQTHEQTKQGPVTQPRYQLVFFHPLATLPSHFSSLVNLTVYLE